MVTKVPETVRKALRGQVEDPQLSDLAAYFFTMAGGTKAVATMLLTEYRAAKPGSLIRQRILDMMLRVTKFANDRHGARDSLGLLSDEDLENEAEQIVGRLPGVNDGRATERRAAPEEAG